MHNLLSWFHIHETQSTSHSPAATGPLGISNAFLHLTMCLVAQSCPTLCNPIDCSWPGSSVHGISQARILERWVPFPSPGNLLDPGIEPLSLASPALASGFFTTASPKKP